MPRTKSKPAIPGPTDEKRIKSMAVVRIFLNNPTTNRKTQETKTIQNKLD
jgi:hypothetical protein